MKDLNVPWAQHIGSPYGYVGTGIAWNDAYILEAAISPKARMSLRMVNYCTAYRYDERANYYFAQQDAWIDAVNCAEIDLHPIDKSVAMPEVESVRGSMRHLGVNTIASDWYVAGFVVCEERGLIILLGYIHDHLELEAPCKLYATVTMASLRKEMHLRFTLSDHRLQLPGEPLFRDVNMTKTPGACGSRNCGDIRVREYRSPKSGRPGMYDVRDLAFAEFSGGYVPVTGYSSVNAWPAIGFNDL